MIQALLILVYLAASIDSAHAGILIGAVVGLLGVTGTAATLLTGALTLALGIGLQVISALLSKKKQSDDISGTTGKLQVGELVPRSFVVGTHVATHSLAYWNSFGQDGKTPNAYVAFMFDLQDLPIGLGRSSLVGLLVNGSDAEWDPNATPETYGVPVASYARDGKNYLWVEIFDGTQTDADPLMVSLFENHPERPYQDNRLGKGCVIARVVCRYERELWGGGFPNFKFVLAGTPLYDPRQDDSVGGTGDMRWSDQSTWAISANNRVVAYNVLRGIRYNDEWQWGGQTIGFAQVPLGSWFAAMNECDVLMARASHPTSPEPQYYVGGEIRFDVQPAEVLEDLNYACAGKIGELGGVYKTHVGAPTVAVLSITDDDILSTDPKTFEPFKSLSQKTNGVAAKYIEPGAGWNAKDAPTLLNASYEAEDNDRRLVTSINYRFATSGTMVQRLQASALKAHRRERTHGLPMPPDAAIVETVVDFVSWTSARNGYVNKLFAITSTRDLAGGNVALFIEEVDPSDYDWDADTDEQPIVLPPTTPTWPTVQGIDDVDIVGVKVLGDDGREKPGAMLIWGGEDQDDVRAVAFEVRRSALLPEIVYSGETPEHVVSEGEYVISANLISNTNYQGRMRFVPFSGRETYWSDWINFTTPLVQIVPADIPDGAIRLPKFGADAAALFEQQLGSIVHTVTEAFNREIATRKIEARTANSFASVQEQFEVQADINLAQATTNTTLQAGVDANTTAIVSEATARTDADSALGDAISSVVATVNDTTASTRFRMTSVVAPIGVAARIEAQARVEQTGTSGETTWRSAGWAIDLISTGGDNYVGRFTVIADYVLFQNGDGITYLEYDGINEVLNISNTVITASALRNSDGSFLINLDDGYIVISEP